MSSASTGASASCSCLLVILLINLFLGGFTFHYCLGAIFDKDAPVVVDVVCGLFLGEFTVPATVVVYLLDVTNVVPTPWFRSG